MVTRDPQKVAFNVANYVLSTFLAGLVFLAFTPATRALGKVLPAFAATVVDFVVNTALLAGVHRPVHRRQRAARLARELPVGAAQLHDRRHAGLLVAWLYLWLGVPGLLLGLPPLYLIYYSYDVYVVRARERVTYDAERDSFRDELAAALALQDELRERTAQGGGRDRARARHPAGPAAREAPHVDGLGIAHRIEFIGEMGGDYYDFIPFGDGRLGIVCGDVMGKGLAAALIMTMARSLIHSPPRPGAAPARCWPTSTTP